MQASLENSSHRTRKGQFSSQSQRKAIPKNVQTTAQLHSSHMLAKECSNPPSQASTEHAPWTSRVKLSLEKAEEPEIKLPTSAGSWKKQESFCFIDYAKAVDCVDHKKLWKILKQIGILDHLTCLLRNLYGDQEVTVRTGWNKGLVPNRKRSASRLYIVTLLF